MSEFVSWIERGKAVLFLTNDMVFNTEKGKLLQQWERAPDYMGHGAIRFYFGLERDQGKNRECADFSTPNNFPEAIAKALKAGKLRWGCPKGLLLEEIYARQQPERDALFARQRTEWDALDDRQRTERDALAARQQPERDALYDHFWELFKESENRKKAWR